MLRFRPFLAALAAAQLAGPAVRADEPRVRTYTNDDLARVAPLAAETGVASVPAFADRPAPEPAAGARGRGEAGESYWRREARRVRDRVSALRERIADLPRPGPLPPSASRSAAAAAERKREATAARKATLEARIRTLEDELAERARREGALPGWLR
jgi:hypothetical protein